MDANPSNESRVARTIVGRLSGRTIEIPDVDVPPIPALAPPGVVCDGAPVAGFESLGSTTRGHPDACSFRRRFGLLVPATNTIMEHELWSIVLANRGPGALEGIGFHTTGVLTPKPAVGTAQGLRTFKRDFLGGLGDAMVRARLAAPQYLIMGCALEHILEGLASIREAMAVAESYSNLSWSTWHDAAKAALDGFGAKRIGILTPWEKIGNASAIRMFGDLGFEVVASVGFSCADVQHIAHVPDAAKEKAVLELLATSGNRLDAIVQCGTNMSMVAVAEKLEPRIGIPILSINAAILWYALRENGFDGSFVGGGRVSLGVVDYTKITVRSVSTSEAYIFVHTYARTDFGPEGS